MTSDSRLVLPLIESSDLSDEDGNLSRRSSGETGLRRSSPRTSSISVTGVSLPSSPANTVPQPETRFHSSDRPMVSC
jgi:hypothetical protein